MNSFFDLISPECNFNLVIFHGKHSKCNAGAIGGGISYIITPTGLGELYSVKCNVCNEELSLNELD